MKAITAPQPAVVFPAPESMLVNVCENDTRSGFTFWILAQDINEQVHESPKPDYMTLSRAEAAGRRWVELYAEADDANRCRMLGWHWPTVKKHLNNRSDQE